MRQEFTQKTMLQKSSMALQQLGDGSGRQATIIGIGAANKGADGTTDTSFTLTAPTSLLKMKLSGADTAVGSAAHLMEGSVVSLMFPCYDEAVTGTMNLTRATCIPRVLALGFVASAGAGTEQYFDAFRVVRIDQSKNEIYCVPARRAAPTSGTYAPYSTWAADQHVQLAGSGNLWCAGTGTVTVGLYRGRANNLSVSGIITKLMFKSVFAPTTLTSADATEVLAAYLVHPGYIPTGAVSWGTGNYDFSSFAVSNYLMTSDDYDAARRMLGIGWDTTIDAAATVTGLDVSLINPFVLTGLESLLFNKVNQINGINRTQVQQYLPTEKDLDGQPLNFNTLFAGVVEHYNRNRDKDPNDANVIQWNVLTMNPLVYSSLLSLSEADRRIIDDTGLRGTSCKAIQVGNKKFELDMHSAMRTDRIIGMPKDSLEMYGCTLDPVTAGSQREFLALNSAARRTNAIEQYFEIAGEMSVSNLRDCLFFRNFQTTIL